VRTASNAAIADGFGGYKAGHWKGLNKPQAFTDYVNSPGYDAPGQPDVLVINDPDYIHLEDFGALAMGVTRGNPLAQSAFMQFTPATSKENAHCVEHSLAFDLMAQKFCNNCSRVDPLRSPIFIHRDDLKVIAPLWLKKSREIAEALQDPKSEFMQEGAPAKKLLQLPWTTEMYGYVFAAAEIGLRHQQRGDVQCFMTRAIEDARKMTCSTIEYTHPPMKDQGRSLSRWGWSKHRHEAPWNISLPTQIPKRLTPPGKPWHNEVHNRLAYEMLDARDSREAYRYYNRWVNEGGNDFDNRVLANAAHADRMIRGSKAGQKQKHKREEL